jgi:hypothetical protein
MVTSTSILNNLNEKSLTDLKVKITKKLLKCKFTRGPLQGYKSRSASIKKNQLNSLCSNFLNRKKYPLAKSIPTIIPTDTSIGK